MRRAIVALLPFLALFGCAGPALRGAEQRASYPQEPARLQARYEVTQCEDSRGQALPPPGDKLALYRDGDRGVVVSEPEGLFPLWLREAARERGQSVFVMVAGDRLLELRLPREGDAAGQLRLATRWEERSVEEAAALGRAWAEPRDVVKHCQVTRVPDRSERRAPVVQQQRPAVPLAAGESPKQPTSGPAAF